MYFGNIRPFTVAKSINGLFLPIPKESICSGIHYLNLIPNSQ